MIRVGIVIEDLDRTGAPWSYAHQLAAKLGDHDDVIPVLFSRRGDTTRLPESLIHVRQPDRSLPLWPDRVVPVALDSVASDHDLDLFHFNRIPDLGHWQVWRTDTPVVATVHGTLHWERIPVACQPWNYRLRRRLFDRFGRFTLARSLAVSDYVEETLVRRAGFNSERVTSTHEAIDDVYFDRSPLPSTDDIPDSFLLHVSNAGPKKNLQTVLRAFACLVGDHDLSLIVAGRGWESKCRSLAVSLGIDHRVTFTGYISQERLLRLYDNTRCFVFPSYHETFGLPNVEAMARGAPVVTSDRFAIPEIVADAALKVADPGDPQAVATAIERVLTDERIRSRLVEAGPDRARLFQWDRHLDKVVGAYKSCRQSTTSDRRQYRK